MAIIKCPECGGQVSSTASSCVHCGCKITVCPDCGKIYGGALKTCVACGASLNGISEIKNVAKEENDKLEKRFNADAKTKKNISRICKVIEIAISVLFFGVLIYGVLKCEDLITAYFNGDGWNYASWQKVMLSLLILTCICDPVTFICEDILTLYIKKRGGTWLKTQKIGYDNYIKNKQKVSSEMTVETALFIEDMKESVFLLENEKEFKIDVLRIAVKLCLIAACIISVAVWAVLNFNAMFSAALIGLKYDFVFSVPSFYSAVIFLCILLVTMILFSIVRSRRMKAWKIKKGFNS